MGLLRSYLNRKGNQQGEIELCIHSLELNIGVLLKDGSADRQLLRLTGLIVHYRSD